MVETTGPKFVKRIRANQQVKYVECLACKKVHLQFNNYKRGHLNKNFEQCPGDWKKCDCLKLCQTTPFMGQELETVIVEKV